MTPELEQTLYNKYPKIFRQKDLPMQETCMCWGVACGDGWYDILDNLCGIVQQHVDYHKLPQVEAVQVKEKFGGLRFYTNHTDDYIRGLIVMAESMSYFVCEECGDKGKLLRKGWFMTLCRKHAQARGKDFDDSELESDTDE